MFVLYFKVKEYRELLYIVMFVLYFMVEEYRELLFFVLEDYYRMRKKILHKKLLIPWLIPFVSFFFKSDLLQYFAFQYLCSIPSLCPIP